MIKLLVVLCALLCFELSASAQQDQGSSGAKTPAESKVPEDAAHATNPVKSTPQTMERAKKLYGYDCAMCHGKNGDGKGDMASDMKTPVGDFTDPATLRNATDGELFYFIKNGKGEMPPEGDRAKVDETWSLVVYIRSLAKKTPPSAAKAAQ